MEATAIRRRLTIAATTLKPHVARDNKTIAGTLSYLLGAIYALHGAVRFGFDDTKFSRPLGVMTSIAEILGTVDPQDGRGYEALTASFDALDDPHPGDGARWLAGWCFNNALHRIAAAADRMSVEKLCRPPQRLKGRDVADKLYDTLREVTRDRNWSKALEYQSRLGYTGLRPAIRSAQAGPSSASKHRVTYPPTLVPTLRSIEKELVAASKAATVTQKDADELRNRLDDAMRTAGVAERGPDDWRMRLIYLQVNDLKHKPSGLLSLRAIGVEEATTALEYLIAAIK